MVRGKHTPTPLKPKDPHVKDGSFRVKAFGGKFHGIWIRVFPKLADWDADITLGEDLYRFHLWPDDGDVIRASYIHDSLPTPKAGAE